VSQGSGVSSGEETCATRIGTAKRAGMPLVGSPCPLIAWNGAASLKLLSFQVGKKTCNRPVSGPPSFVCVPFSSVVGRRAMLGRSFSRRGFLADWPFPRSPEQCRFRSKAVPFRFFRFCVGRLSFFSVSPPVLSRSGANWYSRASTRPSPLTRTSGKEIICGIARQHGNSNSAREKAVKL